MIWRFHSISPALFVLAALIAPPESFAMACNRLLQYFGSDQSILTAQTELNSALAEVAEVAGGQELTEAEASRLAALHFNLAQQLFATAATTSRPAIRENLDRALELAPLHYPSRLLMVQLSLLESDEDPNLRWLEEALSDVLELLRLPAVTANAELRRGLQNRRLELESRITFAAASAPLIPNSEDGDEDDDGDVDPNEFLEQTAGLSDKLVATFNLHPNLCEMTAAEMRALLLPLVDRMGARMSVLILLGRGRQALAELRTFIEILYRQSSGMALLVNMELVFAGLDLAEEMREFISNDDAIDSAELATWQQEIWESYSSGKLVVDPTHRTSDGDSTWLTLLLAGHLSDGDQARRLWSAGLDAFRASTAFGPKNSVMLDRAIILRFEELLRGPGNPPSGKSGKPAP